MYDIKGSHTAIRSYPVDVSPSRHSGRDCVEGSSPCMSISEENLYDKEQESIEVYSRQL